MDELVNISRVRVDVLRARFKMKIENDPRRQLFVLDKALANRNAKFLTPSSSGNVGGGFAHHVGLGVGTGGDDIMTGDALGQHEGKRVRLENAGEPSIAPDSMAGLAMAKDEQVVRSRLTNAAALSQLGVPLKSWMVPGGGPKPSKDNPSTARTAATQQHSSTPPATLPAAHLPQQPLGPIQYGISDKEWRTSVLERTCNLHDLVFFMTYDKELSHSPILTKALASLK